MKSWNEKRQYRRESIRIEATAVTDDGIVRQSVLVVNLSRSGALVELPESVELSDPFTLLFNNKMEPCRVVWRLAGFVGVQFEAPTAPL